MKIVRSCLGRQAAVGINTNSNLIKVDSSAAIVSSVFYFARGVGGVILLWWDHSSGCFPFEQHISLASSTA